MIDPVTANRPHSRNSVQRPLRLRKVLLKEKARLVRHQKAASFQLDELVIANEALIERKLNARTPFQDLSNNAERKSLTPQGFVPCKLFPANPVLLQARKQNHALAKFPSSKQSAILRLERALLRLSTIETHRRALKDEEQTDTELQLDLASCKRELRAAFANKKAREDNSVSLYSEHTLEWHCIHRMLYTRMVNWMCECTVVMNLPPRIFPLSVALLDLYLSKCSQPQTDPNDLHCLGILALWIASKVETQNHLRTQDICSRIGHHKFSLKYFQEREVQFLKQIEFNVSFSLAYDELYYLLKLLQQAFQETPSISQSCFFSLTYLCLMNYISATMISNMTETFSQKEIAALCIVTAILKYSPDVIASLLLSSHSMQLFQNEIREALRCDLSDLKKTATNVKVKSFSAYESLMNRYMIEGAIETKWMVPMIHSILMVLSGPKSPALDCPFSPM